MKLKKLAIAAGIIAAIGATAVSASAMEVVYNGEYVIINGEIINDRAMVNIDELCGVIGAEVSEENGVWSFTKGEYTLSYDEKTEKCTAGGAELALDVAPVMTSNEKLVPIRAFSDALGVKVGWFDWYVGGGTIVLHDFDAYMNKLKVENPEIYTLLTLQIKQPEKGSGVTDMTMNIDVPAEISGSSFKLALKLTETSSAFDGVQASGIMLENLEIASEEFNLALADVTLDGIYDSKTGVMYLKTNAIEKIKDALPSMAAELESIAALLPGDTWYKITMDEYLSLIADMTGVDNSAEMKALFDGLYGDGFKLDKLLEESVSSEDAVNSPSAFDSVKIVVEALQGMVDCGALKVSVEDEHSCDVLFVLNNETLKDYIKAAFGAHGYEWTEEDEAEFDAEFDATFNIDINCAINIKENASTNVDMLMKLEMEGMNIGMSMKSSFDASAETEEITLPETATNLLPLLKSLLSLAEAETSI